MKQTLFGLTLLAVVFITLSAITTQPAAAQVPPGVVIDSIADAISWQVIFPYRAHHLVADRGREIWLLLQEQRLAAETPSGSRPRTMAKRGIA